MLFKSFYFFISYKYRFTTGAAYNIVVSQIASILGIKLDSFTLPLQIIGVEILLHKIKLD